eukprot:6159247-Amphidinium_carterae.4
MAMHRAMAPGVYRNYLSPAKKLQKAGGKPSLLQPFPTGSDASAVVANHAGTSWGVRRRPLPPRFGLLRASCVAVLVDSLPCLCSCTGNPNCCNEVQVSSGTS